MTEELQDRINTGGFLPLQLTLDPLQKILSDIMALIKDHGDQIIIINNILKDKADKNDLENLNSKVDQNKNDTDSQLDKIMNDLKTIERNLNDKIDENEMENQKKFNEANDKIDLNTTRIDNQKAKLDEQEKLINDQIKKLKEQENAINNHEDRLRKLENRSPGESNIASPTDRTTTERNTDGEEISPSKDGQRTTADSQGNQSENNGDIRDELSRLQKELSDLKDRAGDLENRTKSLEDINSSAPPLDASAAEGTDLGPIVQNLKALQGRVDALERALGTKPGEGNAVDDLKDRVGALERSLGPGGAAGRPADLGDIGDRLAALERAVGRPGASGGGSGAGRDGLPGSAGGGSSGSGFGQNGVNQNGNLLGQNGSNGLGQGGSGSNGPDGASGNNWNGDGSNGLGQNGNLLGQNGANQSGSNGANQNGSGLGQGGSGSNGSNGLGQGGDGNGTGGAEFAPRPPSSGSGGRGGRGSSTLVPLPGILPADPAAALAQLREELTRVQQRLGDGEQQNTQEHSAIREELARLGREVADRPDKALIERLFEKFRSSLQGVADMVQRGRADGPQYATADDVKRLEASIRQVVLEHEEAAACRKAVKCLSCGAGYKTTTGSIMDQETMAVLGAAPISHVTTEMKPCFVYGSDNELYYSSSPRGRSFCSPRRSASVSPPAQPPVINAPKNNAV